MVMLSNGNSDADANLKLGQPSLSQGRLKILTENSKLISLIQNLLRFHDKNLIFRHPSKAGRL